MFNFDASKTKPTSLSLIVPCHRTNQDRWNLDMAVYQSSYDMISVSEVKATLRGIRGCIIEKSQLSTGSYIRADRFESNTI